MRPHALSLSLSLRTQLGVDLADDQALLRAWYGHIDNLPVVLQLRKLLQFCVGGYSLALMARMPWLLGCAAAGEPAGSRLALVPLLTLPAMFQAGIAARVALMEQAPSSGDAAADEGGASGFMGGVKGGDAFDGETGALAVLPPLASCSGDMPRLALLGLERGPFDPTLPEALGAWFAACPLALVSAAHAARLLLVFITLASAVAHYFVVTMAAQRAAAAAMEKAKRKAERAGEEPHADDKKQD